MMRVIFSSWVKKPKILLRLDYEQPFIPLTEIVEQKEHANERENRLRARKSPVVWKLDAREPLVGNPSADVTNDSSRAHHLSTRRRFSRSLACSQFCSTIPA